MSSTLSNRRRLASSSATALACVVFAALPPSGSLGSHPSVALRVVDCNAFAHYPNTKVSSARNMTCRQAVRELRRHNGPISRSFRTLGGFRCARVTGGELGGQWRCVKGARAFRFEFGD
jgi:hypothetical protein